VNKQEILDLSTRHVCPDKVATFQALGAVPVMGWREGYRFRDVDGHELIDLHLNGGTFSLGHRNPDLLAVLRDALETLDIGNHHFPSGARAELAADLARTAPGDLPWVVFASGGGEAIDIALKSARYATGRRKVVSVTGGYHGHTGLAVQAGEPRFAGLFHSEDRSGDFVRVPFDHLEALEEAVSGDDVAAVILETIPATSGFPLPSEGYLPGVKALCEAHGALYVADEVQTGLGRTGDLWAVQGYGVSPDVLVTAKGLSGGLYPIAAAVLGPRAGGWLQEDGWAHVSTFGGSEIGCRVAREVLRICSDPSLLARVRTLSERFGAGLDDIRARRPFLVEVRRRGLVMGLRFAHPEGGKLMTALLFQHGIWAIYAGHDPSVVQFKPGLLMDDALAEEILGRVDAALGMVG
jgi:acetylornithine/succinyldiaminopimelate/putrescine aminotransferase